MSELQSYTMATGTFQELGEHIGRLLGQGYVPYGEPFVCSEQVIKRATANPNETVEYHSLRFCQAMVKPKPAAP